MSIPLNASYRYTNNPVELSRYNMIEQQIRPWQVYDAGVLELLGQVRREDFVPEAFRNMAFTGAGRIPYLWRHMVFSAETPAAAEVRACDPAAEP